MVDTIPVTMFHGSSEVTSGDSAEDSCEVGPAKANRHTGRETRVEMGGVIWSHVESDVSTESASSPVTSELSMSKARRRI